MEAPLRVAHPEEQILMSESPENTADTDIAQADPETPETTSEATASVDADAPAVSEATPEAPDLEVPAAEAQDAEAEAAEDQEVRSAPDGAAPAEGAVVEAAEAADEAPQEDEAPQQTTVDAATSEPTPQEAPADEATADEAAAPAAVDVQDVPAPEQEAPTSPAPDDARPTPRAVPRPTPRPVARPAAPAAPAAAPVAAGPDETALVAKAKEFGTVSEDGTVSVLEGGVARVVGQVPGATGDDALALYVRRYLDLRSKILIFESRLAAADLSQHEVQQTLTKLTEETVEPSAVGDLQELRDKVAELRGIAKKQAAAAEEARAAARAEAIVERTALVEEAESLAATDPARIQWKTASEQLRVLLDRWKNAQKSGPRIDRPTEEALWKRFSHARTTFDRERRHFFADLEKRNTEAKTVKERLVAEAERLSSSTEWGATAGAYRDLMAEWKAAGRASRRDDDALWARFRAAQDAFFTHRDEVNSAIDAEYAANLTVKEALLAEAEALLPITDLTAAKTVLRGIQDRWEEAGKVPREAIQRVEGRLRAVEKAVRDHEQEQWDRSNPETKARAEGAAAQLQSAIADLEKDLEAAQASGDARRVKEITEGIAARRSWLDQILKTADGS